MSDMPKDEINSITSSISKLSKKQKTIICVVVPMVLLSIVISLGIYYGIIIIPTAEPTTFEGWVAEIDGPIREVLKTKKEYTGIQISRHCMIDVKYPSQIWPYPETITHCLKFENPLERDVITFVLSQVNDEIYKSLHPEQFDREA